MKKKILAFALLLSIVAATFCSCFTTTVTHAENEHVYGEWEVDTPSTCTQKGIEIQRCECGAGLKRSLAYAPHSWDNGTCTSCKISLFDELYSLIEENGTPYKDLVYEGYKYTAEKNDIQYTIKTAGKSIELFAIDYVTETRYRQYMLTITEDAIVAGEYNWSLAYLADTNDKEVWGKINRMSGKLDATTYDNSGALKYTESDYSSDKVELTAKNASTYTNNVVVMTLIPLLNKSDKNISTKDFGFTYGF